MYIDGGSSMEILYEHCFNRLRPDIKRQMVPATTSLTGFSGETTWPLGQLKLLVTIGDATHSTKAWMNFMIVKSLSPYNGIIGRPRLKAIQAVPSTVHGMLKFPAEKGIVTIRSSLLIPAECASVDTSSVTPREKKARPANLKVPLHPNFPDQEVVVGGRYPIKDALKHRLNVREGCPPVRQKKRGQAPERTKAIQAEVKKLVEARIMREVYYHDWLSNPVMVKKHDGSWRMCVDFTTHHGHFYSLPTNSCAAWFGEGEVSPSSLSPYNGIIRRPGLKAIQAVPSTVHEMFKFPTKEETVTIHSSLLIPAECASIDTSKGIYSLIKCTSTIRQLAYGVNGNFLDEYMKISERSSRMALDHFFEAVVEIYGSEFLRKPTMTDIEKLYRHHEEKHGRDHGSNPFILLEVVASQDLWIWHAFFGVAGSNNDINVLYQSPLFNDLKAGRASEIPFVSNGVSYPSRYYLANEIYPELAPLVKTIPEPADDDHKRILYKQKQESVRKDVKRAFGVLKKKWAVLANPTRAKKKNWSLTNSLDTKDYVKIRTTLLSGHPSHLHICINKLVPSVGPSTR
nr:protein ALP1-like isoform X1 [Tanacetum cinerariifolium]